jgi:hypothetical protein
MRQPGSERLGASERASDEAEVRDTPDRWGTDGIRNRKSTERAANCRRAWWFKMVNRGRKRDWISCSKPGAKPGTGDVCRFRAIDGLENRLSTTG